MRAVLLCVTAASLALTGVAAWAEGDASAPPNPPPAPIIVEAPTPTPTPEAPSKPYTPTEGLDLTTLETKDLDLLYFDPTETYLTPYLARSLHNSLNFHERIFNWRPWERTTVLLKDFSDYGNAAARASPNNMLMFDAAPISLAFETFSAGERYFTLSNHELTHVATMDVWNRRDGRWRRFFGGKPMPLQEHPESILYNYLATPRVNAPRWYMEGSAVFMETWMAGGYGRAQGGYDEMVFRAMVRDDARFFSPLGLESEGTSIDFQAMANAYLYGTRFMSYLGYTRSPEKVIEWLRRDEGSKAYYSAQFAHVFGAPLDDVWAEWVKWEHDFQRANLASVQAYPLTPLHRLTTRALGSVSRSFYDAKTNSLIGGFRYPGVLPHVGVLSLDTGQVRRLTDIKGSQLYRVTAMAYDPDVGKAYFTADNYAYRDLMAVDIATGKTAMLLRDARIGDLALNPKDKAIWGLRHLNGLVSLVRIPPPYAGWNQVHTFKYGEIAFDLDVSPDGEMLSASVSQIDGQQTVRVFKVSDLAAGEATPIAELKLGSSQPEGFVFSPDGKYLFGTAYYTGVSNIYRFEIATQKVEAVTNASTGLFRPIPRPDGSLIAYEYTGKGFTPVSLDPRPLEDLGAISFLGAQIAAKHPVVKTWAVGSPARVPLDQLITRRGKYVALHEMKLGATYPVVEGYKGQPAFGWHAIFEDPMQFNQLTATLSYSPGGSLPAAERWHADVDFHTLRWRLRYWHNDAAFYDLFGPTERARKGDAFIASYWRSIIYDPPRQLDFNGEAALYTGLDTLPQAQNVASGGNSTIVSTRLGLTYTNTTKSLGAVDHEKGVEANLNWEGDYSDRHAFPRVRAGLDFGTPVGGQHASIWLYNAVGVAGGAASNPLSTFYFGAFGNNYVDDGEVKRYRDYDSFPGFGIDEISARRFARSLAELNLPPLRFAEAGIPSLYLSSMRPAVFAGILAAKPGAGPARTYESVGGQIDFNFTLALRLPMTFSVGVAHGFVDGRSRKTEVMASLKIL